MRLRPEVSPVPGSSRAARVGPSLTLHVQLSPPAVTLDEHGGAQEGCPAQRPDKGTEHERELQGPELGQERLGPAPAEAVRDLQGARAGCWRAGPGQTGKEGGRWEEGREGWTLRDPFPPRGGDKLLEQKTWWP